MIDAINHLTNLSVRIAKAAQSDVVDTPYHFHPVKVEDPQKEGFVSYIDFQGLEIDVEVKAGQNRQKKHWTKPRLMHYHYGEIRGTEGSDGDLLDVYVGPNHDSSLVVVIHQHRPDTGEYDEEKVMVGFDSVEEAIGAYKKHYLRPGYYVDGQHTAIPIGKFWRWVHDTRNHGKKVARKAFS